MTKKRVHLVFKTHLDIGFTDHAEKVRKQYHERFIPQAIETGAHFYAENPEAPKFIWTTGAWLIWDYLNTRPASDVAKLEKAIERGLIRWHGLPFTTHTELMSPHLFRAGLSYSQELDRRFATKTIAAKMTDVPGHTLGMVPLLAEAGIRFLHLGVNTASPPPEVPDIFRWRAPGGEEIVVMYQRSYGETCFPEGMADGLGFAHTSDNIGPQSVPQTAETYREMHHREPEAVIQAATLEDYGALMWQERERFPVIDLELADSWIHGSATDPQKISRFLALQRVYDRFAADGLTTSRLAFGRGLAMVAEHTCGVDIKSYLRDDKAWSRKDFEAARAIDHRFIYSEASWQEQRNYLDQAMSALNEKDQAEAEAATAAVAPPAMPSPRAMEGNLKAGAWSAEIDPTTGDIVTIIAPSGHRIEGGDGSLISYRYESYDAKDVTRHMDTYLTHRQEWAVLDHDKPGLAAAATGLSKTFLPKLLAAEGDSLLLSLPTLATAEYGAPPTVSLRLAQDEDGLLLTFVLHEKPANRMPEASFLSFTPKGDIAWNLKKMDLWHKAENTAESGGAQLQAVTTARAVLSDGRQYTIEPLDTPLVAPASWDFMTFCRQRPSFAQGIRFNLHNNKWGTNFPMWCEGNILARFRLRVSV
ncbi:DUF5054 domain-containing protein [Agrobacterium tumefaciens]|uniref:DUF5054 domain-containing protein n=1 Tax=Agrobacterium tumefaciens TaxID=358 RepID=UPI00129B34E2|nr:DUF5054 domain-containing protein [Agrobacterium tumefaciens]MRH97019.1 DUF5054 domain-containing protein [Agrobacterium tumefaciens]WCK22166.1 DUF5054 domain-containing protein [Agrobacterium tumefaciens]